MTVIRKSRLLRLEFRPAAPLPWSVVDLHDDRLLAVFADKASAVAEYHVARRASRQRLLPFYRPVGA